jgi:hypothetical protein
MEELAAKLRSAATLSEKIAILDAHPMVARFLRDESLPEGLSPEEEAALKQLIAIGQFERVVGSDPVRGAPFRELMERLLAIDAFYKELGGIAGYHETILSLFQNEEKPSPSLFHSPSFIDISEKTKEVEEAILWGIEAISEMAEIFPLGGAADRLHLVDEKTGSELPAAKLHFAGRTLLSGLIRDLAAREYLHFKLLGEQIATPVAIMTSMEKDNHRHVIEIAEESRWFGRPKESFRLFTQPLVPVVTKRGEWLSLEPLKPTLKPGGHGAIWKLARDTGVFDWMKRLGRKKALIRQINNPIASLDYGLLAFTGIGWKKGMKFGFASCPRLLRAAEGVNVLIERREREKRTVVLTNVEYCDFAKYGIEDQPLREGEPYSRFSSNTNILFADLEAVKEAVDRCPFPGLLINVKNGEEPAARLESTMQNIADVFVEEKGDSIATKETFVTYNHRHKTISTAKKAYAEGRPLQETPEHCFYDLLRAARELLEKECGFSLPAQRSLQETLVEGPEFVFRYHPALGPLYSIVRQKVQKGVISPGSELELEISDLLVSGLDLRGSLSIVASQPMGHFDQDHLLRYSDRTGRCLLRDVAVRNQGVDWEASKPFWKGKFARAESLEIILKGRSEFIAENVVFDGPLRFEVEDGVRAIAKQTKNGLDVVTEPLEDGPFWLYHSDRGIRLELAAARSARRSL